MVYEVKLISKHHLKIEYVVHAVCFLNYLLYNVFFKLFFSRLGLVLQHINNITKIMEYT